MRKSLIFALLTLFTLSMVMVSCDNNNDPNPPENRHNAFDPEAPENAWG